MGKNDKHIDEPLRNAVYLLKRSQARLQEIETAQSEPVAIVGMACRFPGGASSPQGFWRNLCAGVDAIGEIPANRWDVDAYYDPAPSTPGKMNTRWGGFIDQIDMFDPGFFGISPREAAQIDPQQRLLLEVTWEALESAGVPPPDLAGSQTGVYVGIIGNDYAFLQTQSGAPVDGFMGTGNAHSIAANRLSYVLDLHGPSVALDTACSSSLVAVHLACQGLRNKNIDLAVVGGVNLIMRPEMTIVLSQAQMLSPDGRCRTFDSSANGYVRGEGCGVVVLKRLREAQAAGDRILAVVRGTAVNQDGRSNGISAPNGLAQEAVLRAALMDARLTPQDIGYVETHGTGTPLGDPIEVEALGNVLAVGRTADNPLTLGAVKTNIGHLESAAGIVALIKTVLVLDNNAIPPNLHLRKLNPRLPQASEVLKFPTTIQPWPRSGRVRAAGVSSFGFGGTNAHIIVSDVPEQESMPTVAPVASERSRHVMALSARSEAGLAEQAQRCAEMLTEEPDGVLADIAFSANTGRAHFPVRAAIAPASREQLLDSLLALSKDNRTPFIHSSADHKIETKGVVFLFTGQGSQYARMGMDLYDTQPVFRAALNQCDQILRQQQGISLLALLTAEGDAALDLDATRFTQPALFSLEYALAQMWMSWDIKPAAVLGHSVGEYTAACIAGIYSLEDSLKLIGERARLMQALPCGGGMLAVASDAPRLANLLSAYEGRVDIAAINGPSSYVLSGPLVDLEKISKHLQKEGVKVQPLATSHAFHSALVAPMLDAFEQVAAGLKAAAPSVPLISNVTGGPFDAATMITPVYWRRHVREPVKFFSGIEHLWRQGQRLFLEIGPSTTLIGMGRQCVPEASNGIWLSSLRKGRPGWDTLCDSLATLYAAGIDVDWAGFDRPYPRRRVRLPTYPFQRQRYWSEGDGGAVSATALRVAATGYPLLGGRLHLPLNELVFETTLTRDRPYPVGHHAIYGQVVMAGMAYLEQALAAAKSLGDGDWMLEDVSLIEPLILRERRPVRLQTVVTREGVGSASFKVVSLIEADGESPPYFVTHASGRMRLDMDAARIAQQTSFDIDRQRQRFTEPSYDDAWRTEMLRKSGMVLGSGFTWVTEHWRAGAETLGKVRAASAADHTQDFVMHPGRIDCGLQLLGSVLPGAGIDAHVPIHIERVRVFGRPDAESWCHTQINITEGAVAEGDVYLYSPQGKPLTALEGIRLRRVNRAWMQQALGEPAPQWLYRMAWQKAALAVAAAPVERAAWLVVNDERGLGSALATLLESRGDVVQLLAGDADAPRVRQAIDTVLTMPGMPCRGIIHCSNIDVGEAGDCQLSDLATARTRSWGMALDLVQALTAANPAQMPRLVLVTRAAQDVDGDSAVAVAQNPLWGLARVVVAEHPELRCLRIDLDPAQPAAHPAPLLRDELLANDREDQVAYRSGQRYVARLVALDKTSGNQLRVPEGAAHRLEIIQRGELENVELRSMTRQAPGPGEVEIRVTATGLNFRDVLNVLDLYPGNPGALGGECAGEVVAVGAGVQGLAVGDAVFGLVPASFASHAVTLAQFVVRRPVWMSDEQAATLPIAFLTAHHALTRLGGISKGDRVLIHAASGGVGLAAVQIAQYVGAEIFATVGNAEKREFLRRLGVQHIMDSRALDFADQIRAATNGHGVDLVLNSLKGEAIEKSLSAMAARGHFLELGKTDMWDQERVTAIKPGVKFHAIALDTMMAEIPDYVGSLLRELLPQFESKSFTALPLRAFGIQQSILAFRHMARARHIGKVVVTAVAASPSVAAPGTIHEDGSYLITGGLGGLGLKFAKWLVDRGARHLVLVGRSAPNAAAERALADLRALGAAVKVVSADVSQRAEVKRLVEEITPPLRGVLHAAGTLDDGVVREQSRARFDKVMAAKSEAALYLHELTVGCELDMFVLFSSAASLLGSPGQANYAAANAFLDGLAHLRHSQGLVALAVNWGAWADVGMAAELDRSMGNRLETSGVERIDIDRGLETFGDLLEMGNPQVGVLPIDWGKLLERLPADLEPAWLATIAAGQRRSGQDGGKSALKQRLGEVAPSEQFDVLLTFVRQQGARVMGSDPANLPDALRPFNELGFDSLMAVELCNAVGNAVGRRLAPTLLFDHPTLDKLTRYVASEVLNVAVPETEQDVQAVIAKAGEELRTADALAEVTGMSEDDIDALVNRELDKL